MKPNIKVYLYGTPSSGFETIPPKENWLKEFGKSGEEHLIKCEYKIRKNQFVLHYEVKGISAKDPLGIKELGKCFGIVIHLDSFLIKEECREIIVKELEDFIQSGLNKNLGIFQLDENGNLQYKTSILYKQPKKFDKLRLILEEGIEKELEGCFQKIQDKEYSGSYELFSRTEGNWEDSSKRESRYSREHFLFYEQQHKSKIKYLISIDKWLVHLFETYRLWPFALQIILSTLIPCICLYLWPCKSTSYLKYINEILLGLLALLLIVVIPHKYRVRNTGELRESSPKKERLGDDNRFIAITALIALIALTMTIFSKALVENGNNLSHLVQNSMCNDSNNFVIPNEKENRTHIFCIDKSLSSLKEVTNENALKEFNEDSLYYYASKLNVALNQGSPLIKSVNGKTKIRNIDLSIYSLLKNLTEIQDKGQDKIIIIEFGHSATEFFKGTINSLGKSEKFDLTNFKADNDKTDFTLLFQKITELGGFDNLDIHKRNRYNLVIYSDFFHDTYDRDTKDSVLLKDSLSLLQQIQDLTDKNIDFDISLIEDFNRDTPNDRFIDVKKMLVDELKVKNQWTEHGNDSKSKKEVYSRVLSESRLPFYYINPYKDSINAEILFKEMNSDKRVSFYVDDNFKIPVWGQFSYKIEPTSNAENAKAPLWKLLHPKRKVFFRKNEKLLLNYQGSIYDYAPPLVFNIYDSNENILLRGKTIFIARMPKSIAIVFVALIVSLIYCMTGYVYINVLRNKKRK